jgi:hypothetical protein
MLAIGSEKADPIRYRELMHLHENPNRGRRENRFCNAAMQIKAVSPDDLPARASGGASEAMLHLICSK